MKFTNTVLLARQHLHKSIFTSLDLQLQMHATIPFLYMSSDIWTQISNLQGKCFSISLRHLSSPICVNVCYGMFEFLKDIRANIWD